MTKVIGYGVSFIAVIILSTLWSGYVLKVLWSWFVAGTFGLPQLTVNAAIGLALIVKYITRPFEGEKDDRISAELLVRVALVGALKPALVLGVGWVVHLFA